MISILSLCELYASLYERACELDASLDDQAGGKGRHILNLGHGVLQGTPEESVAAFVNAAKEM